LPSYRRFAYANATQCVHGRHHFVPAACHRADGSQLHSGRPFVTLLQRGSDVSQSAPATRAPGIAGLGASEVTLKGTLASQGGYVAIMQGIDTKTYIVRTGEQLADGTVRSITPDAVVILQQVKDSLSLDKQREVRKTLRQTEEAK
jgi:Tfp pilus assembly protein PilP